MGHSTMRNAKDIGPARWINAIIGFAGLSVIAAGNLLADHFHTLPFLFWAVGAAVFLTALLFHGFLYRQPKSVITPQQLADFRHKNLLSVTLAAIGTWLYVIGGAMVWAQPYAIVFATGGVLMLIGVVVGVWGGIPLIRTARFAKLDATLSSEQTMGSQRISYRNAYLVGLQAAVVLALLSSWNLFDLHASTLGFVVTAVMVLAQVTTLAWQEWAKGDA
ncbi:hypothetical protein [Litoreibacter janthinus]|nr:hypothetical protein [Litoreibacter janthinus]